MDPYERLLTNDKIVTSINSRLYTRLTLYPRANVELIFQKELIFFHSRSIRQCIGCIEYCLKSISFFLLKIIG